MKKRFKTIARWLPACLLAAGASLACHPANASDELAQAYRRAEALREAQRAAKPSIQPRWIGNTARFWYRVPREQGSEFVVVDAERNHTLPAFDHVKLAAALSTLLGKPYHAHALPFNAFEPLDDLAAVRLSVDSQRIECGLRDYTCVRITAPGALLPGEVGSPDGRWAAFVRSHDLYLRSRIDGAELRLTRDGAQYNGYGEWSDSKLSAVTDARNGTVHAARVLWSPDSRKLVTYQLDQRAVPPMPFVQWAPEEGYGARPKVYWAREPLPADASIATARLVIFELNANARIEPRRIEVACEPVPTSWELIGDGGWVGQLFWSGDSRQVRLVRDERGSREVSLLLVDAVDGTVRQVHDETAARYIDMDLPSLSRGLRESTFVWLSAQDGWRHLYHHDLKTGRLLSRITRGSWRVDSLKHIDGNGRWAYFTAGGRESGLDPYYLQLYRATLDGTRIERLTPENDMHEIQFSPGGRYFIDKRSRVDQPPVTVLRRADGRLVRVLEDAGDQARAVQGGQRIERFKAKGRDGQTDIYGTMYLPSNFDASQRYPVLDDIYGGPNIVMAARSFAKGVPIAELGFINVQIDGMGTPGRSRAFEEVSYGEGFAEAGGLADHVAVLEELARRHSFLDLDRVGIYGYSGGGYSATRALLDYPEFFKVAVAGAGSHDQRLYHVGWGEQYIGRMDWNPPAYALQTNTSRVSNLKGKLLLIHGDVDDDVPMVNTMQLVDALIKANKDFDLLIMPGMNHSQMGGTAYYQRRKWDYFVRHLLNREPPQPAVPDSATATMSGTR